MSSRTKIASFPMDFSLKRWLLTQADFFFSYQNDTKHEKHGNYASSITMALSNAMSLWKAWNSKNAGLWCCQGVRPELPQCCLISKRSFPDNGIFPRVCLLAGLWSLTWPQGTASGWRSPGNGDLTALNLLEFIIFDTSPICQAWQNTTCKFKSVG